MVQIVGTQLSKKTGDELDDSAGSQNVGEEPSEQPKTTGYNELDLMLEDLEADEASDLVEDFTIVKPPTQAPEDDLVSKELAKKDVQASNKKSTPKKTTVKKICSNWI